MEEYIDKMKTPWPQPKNMIIEHVNDMHKRPVVIGGSARLEAPYVLCKDIVQISNISHPGVIHHLYNIVIDKTIRNGVVIDAEGNQTYDGNREKPRDL